MRRELGGIPIAIWGGVGLALGWYVYERRRGGLALSPRGILLEAFDEPRERAAILNGIITGVVSAVVSVYIVKRVLRPGRS